MGILGSTCGLWRAWVRIAGQVTSRIILGLGGVSSEVGPHAGGLCM